MTSTPPRSPGGGLPVRRTLQRIARRSVALAIECGDALTGSRQDASVGAGSEPELRRTDRRALLRAVAGATVACGITALILIAPIDYSALGEYGYLGVFVVTLVTTGSFILPVPYLAVILKAGMVLNPVLVALVAGVAAAIGELTGYLVGYGGRSLVSTGRWERAAERWMKRRGFLTVMLLAFIPNPAFDVAGIAAGALSYPVWRFTLACFIGKTAKFLVVAMLGAAV